MPFESTIYLRDLSVMVNVGCGIEERSQKQELRFSFEISFPNLPHACESDRIEDTVCYHKLSDKITFACKDREYATLEKIAKVIFDSVKNDFPQNASLKLKVEKVRPPIEGLAGSASFELKSIPNA
jgi:dihydroneopterin aldolase